MKKLILLFWIMTGTTVVHIQAQSIERQVIASLGGSYSGSDLQADFTVGESVTATLAEGSFILTQGFQQPLKEGISGIERHEVTVDYRLYPNPATGSITLELNSQAKATIKVMITDITGRVLYQDKTEAHIYPAYKETFDISTFAAGAYVLSIKDATNGQLIHGLKFIKSE